MWVSHVFRLPGTYLGVLGHFQVIKGQKPAFLGHFWGMGSLWQWIILDWTVVSQKLDRLRDRGGKIYVCKNRELCSSILRGSNRRLKKSLKNTCFYDMKIGLFWPQNACVGQSLPMVPGPPPSKFMLIITLCFGKMGSQVKKIGIATLYYTINGREENICSECSKGW